ncbi:MAG: Asp23/Gls24 family envelope stress response protein [Parachlamydiaceae bacterium]
MKDRRQPVDIKKVDTKEFEIPETAFIRDIDNKVFQGIVLQVLSKIEGIALIEGNLIDSIIGRGIENVKGIQAEQEMKSHSIRIKVEVNVCYGVSIPDKAEEIQTKIFDEITKLTGLHVEQVHVVFKNIIPEDASKRLISLFPPDAVQTKKGSNAEDYTDEF